MMTYVSSFIRTGNPNPSSVWEESVLPRWRPVQPSVAPPSYLQLSSSLRQQHGLRQNACSFWSLLTPKLVSDTSELGAEPILLTSQWCQSQTEKDAYN
ncbi:hypothetical protein LDENG_00218020 [Lucifuga dentata]|nr:hypothetical protein LDENG_00218020 [Lucifuga dentata]